MKIWHTTQTFLGNRLAKTVWPQIELQPKARNLHTKTNIQHTICEKSTYVMCCVSDDLLFSTKRSNFHLLSRVSSLNYNKEQLMLTRRQTKCSIGVLIAACQFLCVPRANHPTGQKCLIFAKCLFFISYKGSYNCQRFIF